MPYNRAFLAVFCAFVSITSAGILSSAAATPTSYNHYGNAEIRLSPPLPTAAPDSELRKRQIDDRFVCGYGYGAEGGSWTCNDHYEYCKGTILKNGEAYQYCSDTRVANQYVYTTGFGNWPTDKVCPISAWCCYAGAESTNIQTELFIASGYTITGFQCYVAGGVLTWNPNTQLLDPPSFSASLAQLAASTSSSSSTTSSTSTTSTTSSATPSVTKSSSTSGLSSGAKIGIGAGVGAGAGIVLVALAGFIFWRRHQKKKERVAEISPSQVPPKGPPSSYSPETSYSPQPSYNPQAPYGAQAPYSPPISYNETHFKYQQGGAQWSPPMEQSPQAPTDPPRSTELSAQVSPGWDQPYELQGQPEPPRT